MQMGIACHMAMCQTGENIVTGFNRVEGYMFGIPKTALYFIVSV